MAVSALNTTTLTNAIAAGDSEFVVGSTTNIAAGTLLVFAGTGGLEVARCASIPISGRVIVRRGVEGTVARAHPASALIYLGTPDVFKTIKETATALVGDSGALPDYLLPGSRARDGAGNEYVMVDSTASIVLGATVLISKDGLFTAQVLDADLGSGPVGILVEAATSNQWTWAQVFGFNAHAKMTGGSSLATSLGELQASSDVSTPSVGLLGRSSSQRTSDYAANALIYGMFLTGAASTASTSASSETGYFAPVWLNYPYVIRAVTS